jgi:hypothetical protein
MSWAYDASLPLSRTLPNAQQARAFRDPVVPAKNGMTNLGWIILERGTTRMLWDAGQALIDLSFAKMLYGIRFNNLQEP